MKTEPNLQGGEVMKKDKTDRLPQASVSGDKAKRRETPDERKTRIAQEYLKGLERGF